MVSGAQILNIACKELGYHEGANKDNKYGKWYGLNNNAWCLIFVDYVYDKAGMPLPFKTASCGTLLRWYKQYQPECIVKEPFPGCLVIFDLPNTKSLTDHVGLFESMSGQYITTIDGNTSSTNDANGGYVNRRTRKNNWVHAYIKPRGLVEMTGKEIYDALSEYLNSQPTPDCMKSEVLEAKDMGITDGSRPTMFATRAEVATMVKRAVKK